MRRPRLYIVIIFIFLWFFFGGLFFLTKSATASTEKWLVLTTLLSLFLTGCYFAMRWLFIRQEIEKRRRESRESEN